MRRIVPAAVVVILVTLVGGWFLLLPSDLEHLGYSALFQVVFSANVYFWETTNYFSGASDEMPLLHTWSLAVEEQFYLFFPLFLLAIFKVAKLRTRGALLAILCVGFISSLAICIWGTPRYSIFTFYMLPTRAWELVLGAMVAGLPRLDVRTSFEFLLDGIALVGLGAILAACFVFTEKTPFPGTAALLPCIGAAVFIYFTGQRASLGSRLMSARPLVLLGLISYSLYLWHWPLFAFATYWSLEPLVLEIRIGLVLIALLLAWLSWRYVETPFRRRKFGVQRRGMFTYGIGGQVACLTIAAAAVMNVNLRSWLPPELRAIDSAKAESSGALAERTTQADLQAGRLKRLGAIEPAPVSLLVWGDSLARVILPPIVTRASANETAIISVWYSGTPPVLDYVPPSEFSLYRDAPDFSRAVIELVERRGVSDVLLAGWWSVYLHSAKTSEEKEAFVSNLLDTIIALRDAGARVWILQEFPKHHQDPLKALRLSEVLGPDNPSVAWQATRQSHDTATAVMRENAGRIALEGAKIVDASQLLFDNDSGVFRVQYDGVPLYYDQIHLTKAGAEFIGESFDVIFDQSAPVTR